MHHPCHHNTSEFHVKVGIIDVSMLLSINAPNTNNTIYRDHYGTCVYSKGKLHLL